MSDYPCVCISLRKACRKLTAHYDEALEPAGISVTQFSMLRNIKREGPCSLTRLASIVELDRSTLGRNMRVLEKRGLVAIQPGYDQREATLSLTAAGYALIERGTPLWERAQRAIRIKLGTDGAAQLEALLGAL
jgi:DNA-binding MarR family transcriptional regulator